MQVSQRVRKLDTAQANLVATIDRIKLALECGTCVSAVQAALDSQDYEAAAARISEYQSLQDQLPGGSSVPISLPSTAYADQVVSRAREKLLEVVRAKVGTAREAGDLGAMLRFLKLYKPLDVPQEGMAAALSFVRRYCPSLSMPFLWRREPVLGFGTQLRTHPGVQLAVNPLPCHAVTMLTAQADKQESGLDASLRIWLDCQEEVAVCFLHVPNSLTEVEFL